MLLFKTLVIRAIIFLYLEYISTVSSAGYDLTFFICEETSTEACTITVTSVVSAREAETGPHWPEDNPLGFNTTNCGKPTTAVGPFVFKPTTTGGGDKHSFIVSCPGSNTRAEIIQPRQIPTIAFGDVCIDYEGRVCTQPLY